MLPKPRHVFAGKARFSPHASFRSSDFPWIQLVIVSTKSDPHTHGNRQDFASVVVQPWKTRWGQCRDNLRLTNRRDCARTKNRDLRSLRFRTVHSLRAPRLTSSFRKNRHPLRDSLLVRRVTGAQKTLCPPRMSGSKRKCDRGAARSFFPASFAIAQSSGPGDRT